MTVSAGSLAAFFANGAGAAGQALEDGALDRFHAAIDRYVALHRMAARHLPSLSASGDDWPAFRRGLDARAAAIRALRPDAREGDIFTDDVAELLRDRLRRALLVRGHRPGEFVPPVSAARAAAMPLAVNGTFTWDAATPTPGIVLAALPALPPMLQYRFVGEDLALVDIDANLVIDILRDALGVPDVS